MAAVPQLAAEDGAACGLKLKSNQIPSWIGLISSPSDFTELLG